MFSSCSVHEIGTHDQDVHEHGVHELFTFSSYFVNSPADGYTRTRVCSGLATIVGEVGYTLGPALRTLHVKNLGRDLAPERLRTCPWGARGPRRPEKI